MNGYHETKRMNQQSVLNVKVLIGINLENKKRKVYKGAHTYIDMVKCKHYIFLNPRLRTA